MSIDARNLPPYEQCKPSCMEGRQEMQSQVERVSAMILYYVAEADAADAVEAAVVEALRAVSAEIGVGVVIEACADERICDRGIRKSVSITGEGELRSTPAVLAARSIKGATKIGIPSTREVEPATRYSRSFPRRTG